MTLPGPVPEFAAELDRLLPLKLSLRDALHVKSAELWLALDLPELASRELESVSCAADRHPWTLRVQMLVWSALTLE